MSKDKTSLANKRGVLRALLIVTVYRLFASGHAWPVRSGSGIVSKWEAVLMSNQDQTRSVFHMG